MSLAEVMGQVCGLVALGFCIAGFANKNDDRLEVRSCKVRYPEKTNRA